MRLPRLPARSRFGEGRHFSVQARTFQVLAMTEWEKASIF
jgi:hypothetical protein